MKGLVNIAAKNRGIKRELWMIARKLEEYDLRRAVPRASLRASYDLKAFRFMHKEDVYKDDCAGRSVLIVRSRMG